MRHNFDAFQITDDGPYYSGWIDYSTSRASKPNSRWAMTCSTSDLPSPDGEAAEFELADWGDICAVRDTSGDEQPCDEDEARRVAEAVFEDLDGKDELEEESDE